MRFVAIFSAAPRSLLAGTLLLALLTAAMAAEPNPFSGALLCLLAALLPALFALGVLSGNERWRAFCLGGLLPALAACLLGLGLLAIPQSDDQATMAEVLERVASGRMRLGALWLIAGAAAAATAALRHLMMLDQSRTPLAWLRPQFGLRTLFVLIAIAAAWAANYRVQSVRSRQEQEALNALTESGARVLAAASGRHPTWFRFLLGPSFHDAAYHVVLQAPQLNQDTLARLERVPHLAELTIAGPAESETALAELIDRFPQCHIWRE